MKRAIVHPIFETNLPSAANAASKVDLPELFSPTSNVNGLRSTVCLPANERMFSTNNLIAQLDRANISWKAYQESIPGNTCPDANIDATHYAVRHDPFVFFDQVRNNLQYCTNHVRPYSELARDLANQTVSRFNFITPNVTNDMHDFGAGSPSREQQGDTWLARQVPQILTSAAYTNGGLLLIT